MFLDSKDVWSPNPAYNPSHEGRHQEQAYWQPLFEQAQQDLIAQWQPRYRAVTGGYISPLDQAINAYVDANGTQPYFQGPNGQIPLMNNAEAMRASGMFQQAEQIGYKDTRSRDMWGKIIGTASVFAPLALISAFAGVAAGAAEGAGALAYETGGMLTASELAASSGTWVPAIGEGAAASVGVTGEGFVGGTGTVTGTVGPNLGTMESALLAHEGAHAAAWTAANPGVVPEISIYGSAIPSTAGGFSGTAIEAPTTGSQTSDLEALDALSKYIETPEPFVDPATQVGELYTTPSIPTPISTPVVNEFTTPPPVQQAQSAVGPVSTAKAGSTWQTIKDVAQLTSAVTSLAGIANSFFGGSSSTEEQSEPVFDSTPAASITASEPTIVEPAIIPPTMIAPAQAPQRSWMPHYMSPDEIDEANKNLYKNVRALSSIYPIATYGRPPEKESTAISRAGAPFSMV